MHQSGRENDSGRATIPCKAAMAQEPARSEALLRLIVDDIGMLALVHPHELGEEQSCLLREMHGQLGLLLKEIPE